MNSKRLEIHTTYYSVVSDDEERIVKDRIWERVILYCVDCCVSEGNYIIADPQDFWDELSEYRDSIREKSNAEKELHNDDLVALFNMFSEYIVNEESTTNEIYLANEDVVCNLWENARNYIDEYVLTSIMEELNCNNVKLFISEHYGKRIKELFFELLSQYGYNVSYFMNKNKRNTSYVVVYNDHEILRLDSGDDSKKANFNIDSDIEPSISLLIKGIDVEYSKEYKIGFPYFERGDLVEVVLQNGQEGYELICMHEQSQIEIKEVIGR